MRWRALGAAIAALLMLGPLAATAWAAPPQASRAEVLAALGIERRPADYVVVVDVSQSMLADGRYDRVRSALAEMMGALQPGDHVSLVTFGDEARVAYRGTDTQAAVAALPAAPTGTRTDIGAGIAAGLAELHREGAHDTAVLALVTDGTLDAAPGSEFASSDSPGWARLAADAATLTDQRQVAAYAIGLGSETDAGLLGAVFPNATHVPGDRVASHLGNLDSELLAFRAAEALRGDADAAVTATWEGLDPAALAASGTAAVSLTLTSTASRVPVEVGGLAVRATGADASATGLPAAVPLAPGETRRLPVELTVGGGIAPSGAELTVDGTIASPWQDVMAEVGLGFAPTWSPTPVALARAASGPTGGAGGTQLLVVLAAAGGATLVLLVLLGPAILRRRASRLPGGTLRVLRGGDTLGEVLVAGREVPLRPALAHAIPDLVGRVRPRRVRGGATGVRVEARLAGERLRTTLMDGESARVGDLELRFVASATRTRQVAGRGLAAEDDATPG